MKISNEKEFLTKHNKNLRKSNVKNILHFIEKEKEDLQRNAKLNLRQNIKISNLIRASNTVVSEGILHELVNKY